jgi:hypothetical protein
MFFSLGMVITIPLIVVAAFAVVLSAQAQQNATKPPEGAQPRLQELTTTEAEKLVYSVLRRETRRLPGLSLESSRDAP